MTQRPFCASQDSKPSKPADRAYNSPACHPPNKSPEWRWFDLIRVVSLCSDMPACSLVCSPAPAPSAAPPSHAAPRSVQGLSRKDTLQRGKEGAAGHIRQVTYGGGGQEVHVGGHSMDQPPGQIISTTGLIISLSDLQSRDLGFWPCLCKPLVLFWPDLISSVITSPCWQKKAKSFWEVCKASVKSNWN